MSLLWINGTLVDKKLAHISAFDHGLLYGDGVWEPLRATNGVVFQAEEHLQALARSADILGIDIPLTVEELARAIAATLAGNNRSDGYVRVIVTRGAGTIGPDPRKLDPQVIIVAEQYHPFPSELYGHGLHAVRYAHPLDFGSPLLRARTLGQVHLPNAKRQALASGCLEAVLTNHANQVVGATEGILAVVKKESVVIGGGQQPEAMASCIAALARAAGIAVEEVPLGIEELVQADEVFLAGTAAGVIGIVRLDAVPIAAGVEGPVTRQLRTAYERLTHSGTARAPIPTIPSRG